MFKNSYNAVKNSILPFFWTLSSILIRTIRFSTWGTFQTDFQVSIDLPANTAKVVVKSSSLCS